MKILKFRLKQKKMIMNVNHQFYFSIINIPSTLFFFNNVIVIYFFILFNLQIYTVLCLLPYIGDINLLKL